MATQLVQVLYPVVNTQAAGGPAGLGAFAALPITWSTTTPTGADLATYPIEDTWETWVKNFSVLNELEVTLDYDNGFDSFSIPLSTVRNYPNTSLEEIDLVTESIREWRFIQTFPGIPNIPDDEVDFEVTITLFNATPKVRFPSLTSFWPALEIFGGVNVRAGAEYLNEFTISDSASSFNVDFLGYSIPLDITADPGSAPTTFDLVISAKSWFSHGGKWNTSTGALN